MDMKQPPGGDAAAQERLWRNTFFWLSAVMGAFALVDLDAGRMAGAAGDAGVACLMLSLMHQYPMVRAFLGATSRKVSPADLQREVERVRSAYPWTERVATAGWTLLFGSLLLRALGVE